MAVEPVVGVDYTFLGGGADRAAAQEVRGQRDVEDFADATARVAVELFGDLGGELLGHRDPRGVGSAVALPRGQHPPAEQSPPGVGGQRVVQGLHDQADDGPLRPAAHGQAAHEEVGLGGDYAEEAQPAGDASPAGDLHGGEQPHRVGAFAVADRLDVRVRVRVHGGGDRHALREVLGRAYRLGHRADEGFGIGAGERAELGGDAGQEPGVAHGVQEALRAVGASSEHDVAGGERAGGAPGAESTGGYGVDRIAAAEGGRAFADRYHGGHGVDDGAMALREVQVVLGEHVFCAVPTTGHALPALQAGAPGRAGTPEVGVAAGFAGGDRLGGRPVLAVAKEDADRGEVEGGADPHGLGGVAQVDVRRGDGGVGPHPEHAFGLVVEGGEFFSPVGDVPPLRVVVEVVQWFVEGVGVVEGAAADPGPSQDHDVAQQVDALDAEEPQPRRPEEVARSEERRVGK